MSAESQEQAALPATPALVELPPAGEQHRGFTARRPPCRTERQRRARRKTARKCREAVDVFVPAELVGAVASVPRFIGAPERIVHSAAVVAWLSRERARRHNTVPNAIWVRHHELDALFGRDRFRELNERYGMLELVAPATNRSTCAWRLNPEIADAAGGALRAGNASGRPAVMVNSNGWCRRTLPPVIERKSLGQSVWRQTRFGSDVPINTALLARLGDLLAELSGPEPSRLARLDARALDLDPGNPEKLAAARQHIEAMLCRARDALLPDRGSLRCEYRIADTGRLFESGAGALQNAPRVVKRVALAGRFEYDIEACHAAILVQQAATKGIRPFKLADYVQFKGDRRTELMQRVGLTLEEAKGCLAAIAYGSREDWRDDHTDAVTRKIGPERAAAFFADAWVRDLMKDLEWCGRILAPGRGDFTNVAGCTYSASRRIATGMKDTRSTRLAHFVQGFEVLALHAVVAAFTDEVLTLDHDGWTTRSKIPEIAFERVIRQATALKQSVKGKEIKLPGAWSGARAAAG